MQGAQARTRLSRGARLTLRSGGRVGGQDWLAPPTPAGRRSRGLVLSPSSGHVAGVRTSFALTGPWDHVRGGCGSTDARRRRVRRQVVHADRGTPTEALHTHQTRMTRPCWPYLRRAGGFRRPPRGFAQTRDVHADARLCNRPILHAVASALVPATRATPAAEGTGPARPVLSRKRQSGDGGRRGCSVTDGAVRQRRP